MSSMESGSVIKGHLFVSLWVRDPELEWHPANQLPSFWGITPNLHTSLYTVWKTALFSLFMQSLFTNTLMLPANSDRQNKAVYRTHSISCLYIFLSLFTPPFPPQGRGGFLLTDALMERWVARRVQGVFWRLKVAECFLAPIRKKHLLVSFVVVSMTFHSISATVCFSCFMFYVLTWAFKKGVVRL